MKNEVDTDSRAVLTRQYPGEPKNEHDFMKSHQGVTRHE